MKPDDPLHLGWEFLHETFRAAHAFTDCQGRPLGEANAPEACQRGVPFEWRECKYPGSRLHHALPMNVTALRQMTDHWPEVTAAVELLHRSYVAHFRPPSMTLLHAWRLAKFGTVIPAYLLCRPVERLADGQIPVSAAALFKMLAGVFQTVQHMVLFGAAFGAVPTELPDPEALLAYADANDLLLDQRGVCAGPPKLIANVLHLLLRGTPGGGGEGELARSLPDFEGFFRYAAADSALQLRKFTFALATRADAVALHEELRASWPRSHATRSVGAYLERSAEAWPIPLPDSLLDPSAADVRRRLEGVIDAEARALDEWLAARAAAPPSRPPRSSRPPRPAYHDAPEPPSATDPAAPTAPPPDGAVALAAAALALYAARERTAAREFEGRQAALDAMGGRGGGPFAVDAAAMTRAFGETPRDALGALLGAEPEPEPARGSAPSPRAARPTP